jgi:hypothetical protein
MVYTLHACDTDINNVFSRYLKLSENKFTEHKMGQLGPEDMRQDIDGPQE